jgi:hypothetical protein
VTDIVLASPIAIAQALLATDVIWAAVYLVFGFLLNWLFGMVQVLLFEDSELSIGTCFVWSAAVSLSPSLFSVIFFSCLFVFLMTPLVVTTPFLIVFQLLTFFEAFGYSSPAEVHYLAQVGN